MNEQWKQLKDTIVDIRDSNEFEHEDVTLMCRFLVNYMEVLEKQMQEPREDTISRQTVLDIVDSYSESKSNVEDVTQDILSNIVALSPVNPQSKTEHCKDCKWRKDSDGVFRRGIEAESQCPIIEPQETEKYEHMTADEFAELFTESEDKN